MNDNIQMPGAIRLYSFNISGKIRRLTPYEVATFEILWMNTEEESKNGKPRSLTISGKELGELTGMDRVTVIRHLKSLTSAGLIKSTIEINTPNTYTINGIDTVYKELNIDPNKAKAPRRRGRKPKERSDNHE